MSDFLEDYSDFCAANGTPDRLELMLCDVNAVLRGKWLPGDGAQKLASGGVRLPLSTYAPNIFGEEVGETGLGLVEGDPDGVVVATPGTLRPVPWAAGNVAQVLVELQGNDGAISQLSGRETLAAMVRKFSDRGLHPVVATELEFYLLQPRANPEDPPQPPDMTPEVQNLDLEVLDRQSAILDDIRDAAAAQNLPTDTLIAEYGPGQFEINFHHTDDVLGAADTALMFHRLVRGVAAKHGLEATFMAKPYADFPGNGMHVHASLLNDAGDNIFSAAPGQDIAPALANAVAGLLDTMRPFQAVFAPHLNSYRRFQPMSFAPSSPDWGLDNRAAGVRIPATHGSAARLEHRISGADVNPYLALAAILGGILHGLDSKPALPPSLDDDQHSPADPLTSDWSSAVEAFAAAPITADVLGTGLRDIYAILRRDEISRLTRIIAPIEYQTYLSRL